MKAKKFFKTAGIVLAVIFVISFDKDGKVIGTHRYD
jgi:hypothetical protein